MIRKQPDALQFAGPISKALLLGALATGPWVLFAVVQGLNPLVLIVVPAGLAWLVWKRPVTGRGLRLRKTPTEKLAELLCREHLVPVCFAPAIFAKVYPGRDYHAEVLRDRRAALAQQEAAK